MPTFKATCLTPVHIGNGETIDLLDYKLEGSMLHSLDISRFVIELPDDKKSTFEGLIDNNNIIGLRRFIAENCNQSKYANRYVNVGKEFEKKYNEKFDDLRNQMEVHSFIFSEQKSKNYIPGSSIKGSIRTAIVNKYAPEGVKKHEDNLQRLKDDLDRHPKFKEKKRRALQKEKDRYRKDFAGVALNCNIQNDPFRVVKVSDSELPDASTEIVEIQNCIVDKEGQLKPNLAPMWYEVTSSKFTGNPITFEVDIEIDQYSQKIGSTHLSKKIGQEEILKACNQFYLNRLTWEHDKFYSRDKKAGSLLESLFDERFGGHSFLLRIGRFSHFESLSVDNFRKGDNPKKKETITEGSTRNLYKGYLPLGWIRFDQI